MTTTTTTPTPLTDAELNWLTEHLPDAFDRNIGAGAAAEIRAQRDDLLAALKALMEFSGHGTPIHPGADVVADARACIARAERRAE